MLINGKLVDAILMKKEEFANIESLHTGNTIGPMSPRPRISRFDFVRYDAPPKEKCRWEIASCSPS
jgi:hypothetical protein